uniref:Glutaredoxin domain-containing protein n=1 Tax=Lactuca sativa TaxID=4236 RepID=A0A9R1WPR4_LACSA|nr:hypothetical protein LSAT_V11C900456800 [Lactuca sativa]
MLGIEIRKEKYEIFMAINIITILPFHSREVKGCIKGKVVIQDLDKHPKGQQLEKELKGLGCKPSVPAVFIGQQLIGGANEIMTLHLKGQLVPLLLRCNVILDIVHNENFHSISQVAIASNAIAIDKEVVANDVLEKDEIGEEDGIREKDDE